MKQKHKSILLFFIAYSIITLWILIFKCNVFIDVVLYPRNLSLSERFVRYLIPFSDLEHRSLGYILPWDIFLIVMNVLLFIPIGILSLLFFNKWQSFAVVFLAPLIIELFQLFAVIGVFATTDLITNTLGGLIGLLLYKLLFSKLSERRVYEIAKYLCFIVIPIAAFAIIQTCFILPAYF